MSSRYFVFLYPEPGQIKGLLDLAIYVLNPKEKWPAHITVAGPFRDRRSLRISSREYQSNVFVFGSSNFFASGSATVYLNVGFNDLDSIWKKPNFKLNPIPHVSVYDGPDMKFAQKVSRLLRDYRRNFLFETRGLHVVESIPGQYRSDLKMAVDLTLLETTSRLSHDDIDRLSNWERLQIAKEAITRIPVANYPIAI